MTIPKKIDRRTLSENKIGKVGAKKKKEKDKVKPVTTYIKSEHIDNIGGIEVAKEVAKKAIMKAPIIKSKLKK